MHLPGRAGGERSLHAALRPVDGTQEDVEEAGDRDAEERAEDAAQFRADQQRRHGNQRMDAGGGTHDARPKDVGLDRVAVDRHDQGEQADHRPLEDEGNEHGQAHANRGAEQGQKLEEKRQDPKHHGVGNTDDRHREARVGAHDQRHDQLTPGVLAERGANGEQREVIDLFVPDKELAHAGDQLAAFGQQVDRDHQHEEDIDQRSQRAAQDAEDRSEDGRADAAGARRQAQLERDAGAIDRVLQVADQGKGSGFQRRKLLGLADQGRRDEHDQPGDHADDDHVQQQHGEDPPAFEQGHLFHPVDHGGEEQGDDGGEDEQQKDVEEVNDQVLTLVKEHHGRKRDQEVDQDLDGALEMPPAPDQEASLLVLSHQASLADRRPAKSATSLAPCRGSHVPFGPLAQLEEARSDGAPTLGQPVDDADWRPIEHRSIDQAGPG